MMTFSEAEGTLAFLYLYWPSHTSSRPFPFPEPWKCQFPELDRDSGKVSVPVTLCKDSPWRFQFEAFLWFDPDSCFWSCEINQWLKHAPLHLYFSIIEYYIIEWTGNKKWSIKTNCSMQLNIIPWMVIWDRINHWTASWLVFISWASAGNVYS